MCLWITTLHTTYDALATTCSNRACCGLSRLYPSNILEAIWGGRFFLLECTHDSPVARSSLPAQHDWVAPIVQNEREGGHGCSGRGLSWAVEGSEKLPSPAKFLDVIPSAVEL